MGDRGSSSFTEGEGTMRVPGGVGVEVGGFSYAEFCVVYEVLDGLLNADGYAM